MFARKASSTSNAVIVARGIPHRPLRYRKSKYGISHHSPPA